MHEHNERDKSVRTKNRARVRARFSGLVLIAMASIVGVAPENVRSAQQAVGSGDALASAAVAPVTVTRQAALYTLQAQARPLHEVLSALAGVAGFKLSLFGDLADPVTVNYQDRRLDELLGALTAEYLVISEFADDDAAAVPAHVRVYGGGRHTHAQRPATPTAANAQQLAPKGAADEADMELISALTQTLNSDAPHSARVAAVDALVDLDGELAVNALAGVMPAQPDPIRERIISRLTGLSGEWGARGLGLILNMEPDPSMRARALDGLLQQGTQQALGVLHEATANSLEDVRTQAAEAMAALDGEPAVK